VNRRPRIPNKPLFDAIERNRPDLVRQLIAEGMSVQDPYGEDGDTPLGAASRRGNPEILKALLEAGADPNKAHSPPILDAVGEHCWEIAYLLLDAGADVTVRGEGEETLLMVAVSGEDTALLQRLIDAGVDPQATDRWDRTALDLAAQWGHWVSFEFLAPFYAAEVVEKARSRGAPAAQPRERVRPPATDGQAFAEAVAAGDHEAIRALAARHVPLNEIDPTSGETPLLAAINAEDLATVELLLELSADPDFGGVQVPLTAAVLTGEVPMVEALLAAEAEVDQPGEDGITPLMSAASAGHLAIVKRLVELGADPTAQDDDGRTALDVAKECGQNKVAQFLAAQLKAGKAGAPQRDKMPAATVGAAVAGTGEATAEAQSQALLMAVSFGDPEGVQSALQAGADVNLADDAGRTPLTLAVQEESLELVELLLQHGADPSRAGRKGYTPLQLATTWCKSVPIVKTLMAAGADTEGLTPEEWEARAEP
jgi:ankyrin repeat protein